MKRKQEFFRGCMVGGAIGDALGWPVEFLKLNEIIHRFGPDGIKDLQLSLGKAEVTDDTQMTLFTAEGILRSKNRSIRNGVCHTPSVIFYAYQRWLLTQGYLRVEKFRPIYDGWLLNVKELYARRAPGNACLSSLLSGKQGTMEDPINNSKGCGGVMRVAPAGLFYLKESAFEMAAEFAALTHGHPSGYLAAGTLAYLIACIIEGQNIDTAVENALLELASYHHHEQCTRCLMQALELSKAAISDVEAISQIGEGWVGEEALGISVYCALKYPHNFEKALIAAVNHDGDSDSTGAITGNILGAYLGLSGIPAHWTEHVELHDVLVKISDDLLVEHQDGQEWWDLYPGS